MGRCKYRHHGQPTGQDPRGQEDEGVIRERLGGLSGLRIDMTARLNRVLSGI
jgi:hypothetical protein